MAMNKQTGEQVGFFLQGMLSRLDENRDFFKNIEVRFTSGAKEFPFTVSLGEGRKLNFIFTGVSRSLAPGGFVEFIKAQIPLYDKMSLNYRERGANLFIEAEGKNVKSGRREMLEEGENGANQGLGNREYYIKADRAQELLKVIGIMGDNGKIKNNMIRKYNQTDHFVELAQDLLIELSNRHGTVNIVDCACGKSYLSFVLNYYIKEELKKSCFFTCIDYNDTVINASRDMCKKLGYNNMEFIKADIMNYRPDRKQHLLLTLHACDTATDKALAVALNNNIDSIICVPCCHRELLSQYNISGFEEILKYGILKARLADSLTDGLRCLYLESRGYEVTVSEYISPLDTPKNLMIKALKVKNEDGRKKVAYENIVKMLGASP
ncbi:MAG: SAM-dependent methyltransferase, partial [Clostridiales bacterium]|nr:SAM-dependent methyltransferase [Clostridiales bacterium]